jgi:hypothetical protein
MARQCDCRLEDPTTFHASRRLTSTTPVHVSLEGEPMHPSSISTLAAHVLEVEIGGPDMLRDVPYMDTMPDPEAEGATRARASTDTAGPSTEDAMRATWYEVLVKGGKVYAKNGFVGGNVLVTVVDHATHGRRRRGLGNGLTVRWRRGVCCRTGNGGKRLRRREVGLDDDALTKTPDPAWYN